MRQMAPPAALPATACSCMVRACVLHITSSFTCEVCLPQGCRDLQYVIIPHTTYAGEQWVAVDSDRHSCLACLSTMVRNTADCQPLYDDVLSLYASFGMALPTRPPLLLVRHCSLPGPPGAKVALYHKIGTSIGMCMNMVTLYLCSATVACLFTAPHEAPVGQHTD